MIFGILDLAKIDTVSCTAFNEFECSARMGY